MMKRLACMVVSVLLAAAPFLAPAGSAEQGKLPVTSLDLLAQPGISIAVGLNTPAEASLKQDYPQATLIPYSDIFLAYLDVANGRVDACVNARREMEFAIEHGFDGVRLLEDNYATNRIAVGISPVSPISGLKDRLNAFIAELRADGTLDDMYERWVTRGEETMPEIPEAENPAFTLRVGTTGTVMPYSYYIGTELAGYDIELARRFAARIGAKLELKVYDFGGIIPAAEGGSIDCIMSNLFYTEEKEESIPFSDVLFTVEITAMVRDGGQPVSAAANGQLARLDGKRIGAATGTTFDAIVRKALPAAEIVYINTAADLIAALEAGKIDGFAVDEPAARQFCRENPRLAVPDEYMDTFEFGFVLPKTTEGEALLEELDAWLVSLKADGGLEQIIEKWTNGPEEEKTLPDYDAFPAPKGVLTLATEGDYVPMTYYRGNRIVGAEIDLAARFCEACGYGLEIKVMNFDGILPAVQSGKADLAAAGITITDERRESVNFSAPYYSGGTVMVVLKDSLAQTADSGPEKNSRGFPDSIVSSFNKTFVREGRWRLFVDGILTTLLITVLTILLGTLLGFTVFMLCRNGNPAANLITRFCMWLIQGMPMVVLLMIFYYVIFGSVSISGIAVAVMGFTLTFGSSVFGLLKMGVGALDKGQYEAAYALGYSNLRTFFRIILPQALPHVLPAYKGEIVGLIKATAIVGYIAVQDLTKMGDIVRSRTYEAFFPLIAVTIIYFVLEGLIGFFVSRISVSFDPRRRKPADILKGDEPPTTASGRSFVGGEINRKEAETVVTAPQLLRVRDRQMIRIEHLKKEYPNVTPLQDVSVEIRDGDVISVIGPSGTGKSTLLRCINLLEKPTSGRIRVDGLEITDPGCDINKVRRKMGMVFQNFNLFGHRTVIENIMMAPMDLLGRSKQEAYDTGMRLLRMVGLAEKALNYPDELSGGQKQRIAIARTLAMDPDVILLDEPTSALDPTMVGEVQAVIRDLAKSGKTMMIVTHEMNFARAISNRVFYMDEGGIYEDGSPEQVFDHPLRENTRRFVRRLKVLELDIESRDYDFLGMAGRIEDWCARNQVAPKQANRVQLVFEETMQLLVPALENPRVQAVCEYSAQTENAEWTLLYAGPRYDMASAGDGLALTVLKGMTQSMEYTWNEGAELPNRLRLVLR